MRISDWSSDVCSSDLTYDGFNETVDAFRLVSMIFADPRYETLVLIVAVAGIALGALLASVRGNGMGIVAFGFQTLVGIGLFVGMVATTGRSEEHTSELQSLMRISYAVFCLKKKKQTRASLQFSLILTH